MKTKIRFALVAAFAAALFLPAQSFAVDAAPATDWVPPATYATEKGMEDYDIVVGKADAPVTIYEYASLTCPHCKAFQETSADEVKKEWIDTGKAKLVYRHYPLDQSALLAALTVDCLPADKRYDAVKLFFKTVDEWAANKDVVSVLSKAYGPDFTLKPGTSLKDSLVACIARKDFPAEAMKAMFDAGQHGVNSTPYFIIDGEHVRGDHTAAEIGDVIRRHLAAKGK